MGSDDKSEAKRIAHYQTLLSAWIEVNLERDRTLLSLSTAAIGLLVTILTTTGAKSSQIIWLYVGAFIGFLTTIVLCFKLYRANAAKLKDEIVGHSSDAPILKRLDAYTLGAFVVGVGFAISIGVTSAATSLQAGEVQMAQPTNGGDKIEKSLDGIEGLRPDPRPADPLPPSSQPSENPRPAEEQSQDSGSAGNDC